MKEHNDKQEVLDRRYLRMAHIWAENSYCERRKVGAILVKDKMIISDGYNGTPVGFENVCEDPDGITKPYVLHADSWMSEEGVRLLGTGATGSCELHGAGTEN